MSSRRRLALSVLLGIFHWVHQHRSLHSYRLLLRGKGQMESKGTIFCLALESSHAVAVKAFLSNRVFLVQALRP